MTTKWNSPLVYNNKDLFHFIYESYRSALTKVITSITIMLEHEWSKPDLDFNNKYSKDVF